MAPELVLLITILVAGALLAVTFDDRLRRLLSRRYVILAALPLLTAALLTAYVFGEDSYRGNGISRWDAYRSPGGALGPMFVLSILLLAACAGVLLFAAVRKRARLLRAAALGGAVTSLALVMPTIFGFTLN
jgi:uncharacterized membrane protein YdcZ (DUF606 family)